MNTINHAYLLNAIKQEEMKITNSQLKEIASSDPAYLKLLVIQRHKERLEINELQRQVIKDHHSSFADPSRLGAQLGKGSFLRNQVKKDDFGKKKPLMFSVDLI